MTAAKTTPTRSCGRSVRTTAWPTPSRPPATSPPAPGTAQSGSAPNANHQDEGAQHMAADNHTTIVGNLVEDPEVRFTGTGIAVTNLRVAVTQRVQADGSRQHRDNEMC